MEELTSPNVEKEVEWIISVVQKIRSIRAEMGIDPGIRIPVVLGKIRTEKLEKIELSYL